MDRIKCDVAIDGTPDIMWIPRPNMKVADGPHLAVAIPVGDKNVINVFTCPKEHGGCGSTWASSSFRNPYLVPGQLMSAIEREVMPLNTIHIKMIMGQRLSAEARQIMTKEAIRRGVKYILYWDDDTIPPEDGKGLYTMHNFMERNPHVGAISGVYTTRENPPAPLVFKQHGAGHYWDMPLGPKAWPVPIFGAGAGFLLARIEAIVDVIERMKEANGGVEVPIWQDERILPNPDELDGEKRHSMSWGHDVRFCKLLNDHDWPVFVDGRVLCGHLDIATQQIFRMPEDAPGFQIAEDGRLPEMIEVPEVLDNAEQKHEASQNDACCGARQGLCEEDGNPAECCQGVCEGGQTEEEGEA